MHKFFMPFIGLYLIIGAHGFAFASTDEAQCLQAVTQFFDIKAKTEAKLTGSNSSGPCDAFLLYSEYISGITKEPTADFVISIFDKNEPNYASASVHFNNSLQEQKIKKCEVNSTDLEVHVTHRHKEGWRKKFVDQIKAKKDHQGVLKQIFVSSREKRSFEDDFVSEVTCNF